MLLVFYFGGVLSSHPGTYMKAIMGLTRADHLFIDNYIISLLNIILRYILRPIQLNILNNIINHILSAFSAILLK